MITVPHYTLSAHMFDYAEGTMTADIAALDVPDDYDTDRYHFYCSACAQEGHFTRLKHVEEQGEPKVKFEAPRRFNLFDHKDSAHICDEAVRFQAIDNLAHRYNAGIDDVHQYEFSDVLREGQKPVLAKSYMMDAEIKTVDRASRLAAITYFLMYDQELMSLQKLKLADASQKFRQGFFDASKEDKKRIFRQALAETSLGKTFRAAMIFQPNAYLPAWKQHEDEYGIPGAMGPNVANDGSILRPINMLWCQNARTYYQVREMADRNGQFSPLLVMGDVMLSTQRLEAAQNKSRGTQKAETVYTVIKISDPRQAAPWDFDTKFADAVANQNKVQEERKAAMMAARAPLLEL